MSLFTYKYPHPAMTADCVIFGFDGRELKVLLIERGIEPYKGMWALPGGFMKIDETIEETARRELSEETGLENIYMEQFRVYSDVGRDPRERVVTVAFIALVRPEDYRLVAGDDAVNALWFSEDFLPPMAFDHRLIISQAREYLSEMLRLRPAAFELLNRVFSLGELQSVYEVINRRRYDRRNFQRKALQSGYLMEIDEANIDNNSRASVLRQSQSRRYSDSNHRYSSEADEAVASKGRPTSKLFSFRNILKKKTTDRNDENEKKDNDNEGSTRDLFDFMQ